jgi:hypothetical protein
VRSVLPAGMISIACAGRLSEQTGEQPETTVRAQARVRASHRPDG